MCETGFYIEPLCHSYRMIMVSYIEISGSQCRINHGADGARAGGPPAEGAPEQNIFFTTTWVGSGLHCPARDMFIVTGTVKKWINGWKKASIRQIMFDCWPASLDWRFPSSDCGLRQPVRTVILLFLSTAWCFPCRPTVCVASRIFDVLPTTYISTTNLAACVCVCAQNLTNFCPHAFISNPNVPKIVFA